MVGGTCRCPLHLSHCVDLNFETPKKGMRLILLFSVYLCIHLSVDSIHFFQTNLSSVAICSFLEYQQDVTGSFGNIMADLLGFGNLFLGRHPVAEDQPWRRRGAVFLCLSEMECKWIARKIENTWKYMMHSIHSCTNFTIKCVQWNNCRFHPRHVGGLDFDWWNGRGRRSIVHGAGSRLKKGVLGFHGPKGCQ